MADDQSALYAASLKEFKQFIQHCGKQGIPVPYLIGGWAVYAHAQKAQSIDLDFVFEQGQGVNEQLRAYYKANSFVQKDEGDQQEHWVKPVVLPSGNTEFLRLDYFTFDEENQLAQDHAVRVPWSLLTGHHKITQLSGIQIRIPELELLLLYKALAYLDKRHFLQATGITISAGQRLWMQTKIKKDRQDMIDLLNTGMLNEAALNNLLRQTHFGPRFSRLRSEELKTGQAKF